MKSSVPSDGVEIDSTSYEASKQTNRGSRPHLTVSGPNTKGEWRNSKGEWRMEDGTPPTLLPVETP